MKCSLCGTELLPGNNICPSCGALNMAFEQTQPSASTTSVSAMTNTPNVAPVEQIQDLEQIQQQNTPITEQNTADQPEIIDNFVDLDEGPIEEVKATADMAAPTLEVNQENLSSGVKDISSSGDVSTYDPEAKEEVEETEEAPKEAGVNFALPEVQEATKDTQGMEINEVSTPTETVGDENHQISDTSVVPEKKEKFSLKIFKKKVLPRNLVIILVVIALVIGVLLGSTMFGKQVYTPGTTRKTTQEKVPHVADGSNNITYNGKYLYKIPTDFDFDKTDTGILVYDKADEYRIFIKAVTGSYEYLANAKESITATLNNDKANVHSIKETAIGDNKYIVIEATVGTRNRLYALRAGNEDTVFYMEIVSKDYSYNYTALDIADDIINNAEYHDKYSTMESVDSVDMSDLIIRAGVAHNNP
jgi:hypothetical protein